MGDDEMMCAAYLHYMLETMTGMTVRSTAKRRAQVVANLHIMFAAKT